MTPDVLFLGGNGHASIRLEPARAELRRQFGGDRFRLVDLIYPSAPSYEALLDALDERARQVGRDQSTMIYATGIGGLVALSQRARGRWLDSRIVLQGAVLWGLESRLFPKLMRIGPAPRLLASLFGVPAIQRRFVTKHFERPPEPELMEGFFAGYRDARRFASWFDWLRPSLLRELEASFAERPEALENVEAWWGGRDTVVTPEELRKTEAALGVSIPCSVRPEWGHYPMIDDPEGWVAELCGAMA